MDEDATLHIDSFEVRQLDHRCFARITAFIRSSNLEVAGEVHVSVLMTKEEAGHAVPALRSRFEARLRAALDLSALLPAPTQADRSAGREL